MELILVRVMGIGGRGPRIVGNWMWGMNQRSVRMMAAIFGLIKWKDGGRAGLGGGGPAFGSELFITSLLEMQVEEVSSDWKRRAGCHRHPDSI